MSRLRISSRALRRKSSNASARLTTDRKSKRDSGTSHTAEARETTPLSTLGRMMTVRTPGPSGWRKRSTGGFEDRRFQGTSCALRAARFGCTGEEPHEGSRFLDSTDACIGAARASAWARSEQGTVPVVLLVSLPGYPVGGFLSVAHSWACVAAAKFDAAEVSSSSAKSPIRRQ